MRLPLGAAAQCLAFFVGFAALLGYFTLEGVDRPAG
jgi:hypothetical protein